MPSSAVPFTTRYSLYKAGTAKVIDWLQATAEPQAAKLDTLKTADLVKLAEKIVYSSPVPDVPLDVVETLEEVITARRLCTDWYVEQNLADHAHLHFMNILECVHTLLKEARKLQKALKAAAAHGTVAKGTVAAGVTSSDQRSRSCSSTLDSSTAAFIRIRARLDIEEGRTAPNYSPPSSPVGNSASSHSLDGDGAAQVHEQAGSAATSATLPSNADENGQSLPHRKAPADETTTENDDERRFVLWCLLKDLADVREHIRQTWREYDEGTLSFLAAATITNVAFGIMRRAEATVVETNPEFGDYAAILQDLNLSLTWRGGKPCLLSNADFARSETSDELVRLLCPEAAFLVKKFVSQWNACPRALVTSHEERVRVASSPPKKAPSWCAYHPFAAILIQELPQIHCFAHNPHNREKVDEFMGIFFDFVKKQDTPNRLWFINACQAYMDMFAQTSLPPKTSLNLWRSDVGDTLASLERYKNLRDLQNGPFVQEWCLRQFEQYVTDDGRTIEQIDLSDENGVVFMECGDTSVRIILDLPLRAFRRLPLTLANNHYWLKFNTLQMGLHAANNVCIVIAIAHVYKAVRALGLAESEWKDMEWLINRHSVDKPLVPSTGLRHSAQEMWENIQRAFGVHKSHFLTQNYPRQPITHASIARNRSYIVPGSSYLRQIVERHSIDERLGFSRGEAIDIVLRTISEERLRVASHTKAHVDTSISLTPVDLVETFKTHFIQDEAELRFDYIGLTADCEELMSTIRRFTDHRLGQATEQPASWREGPQIISELVWHAAHRQIAGNAIHTTPLAMAAKLIDKHVKAHGADYTKIAFGKLKPGGGRPSVE